MTSDVNKVRMIKDLRHATGCTMAACNLALINSNWDAEKALEWLRQDGRATRNVISYSNGIEMIDNFIAACKELDPPIKSIKITMKGDFNREITKDF